MLLLPASLLLLMVAGASFPALLGFVLLYGAGLGLYTIVRATTPAELFGRAIVVCPCGRSDRRIFCGHCVRRLRRCAVDVARCHGHGGADLLDRGHGQ